MRKKIARNEGDAPARTRTWDPLIKSSGKPVSKCFRRRPLGLPHLRHIIDDQDPRIDSFGATALLLKAEKS